MAASQPRMSTGAASAFASIGRGAVVDVHNVATETSTQTRDPTVYAVVAGDKVVAGASRVEDRDVGFVLVLAAHEARTSIPASTTTMAALRRLSGDSPLDVTAPPSPPQPLSLCTP